MFIEVASVVLAATHNYKKRKGIPLSRIRAISRGITTKREPITGKPNQTKLTVGVHARQFTGKLEGILDRTTGNVEFRVVEENPTSYLKKHRFTVVGYNLSVRMTNAE